MTALKPAQKFSFVFDQVCDDEWHHYAINVNFPEVELLVDGDKWIDERDNPEIIDDWPLHPAGDIKTKITIGACWQGKIRYKFLGVFGKKGIFSLTGQYKSLNMGPFASKVNVKSFKLQLFISH